MSDTASDTAEPNTADCQDQLRHWLRHQGLANTAPLEGWIGHARGLHLDREAYLLRAGEPAPSIHFLVRGLLRYVYITPAGKERNKAFYGQRQLVGAVSAAMTGGPAPFSIQALEPSVLLALPYRELRDIAEREQGVARLLVHLLSEAFIRNEQREAMLLTGDARQRYAWLCEREPELLDRLPQHHIAAYIGVDAVSLSRLKRNRPD